MQRTAKQPAAMQFKANLPAEILGFLKGQAERFGSSVNSEITRAVRERMDRVGEAAGEGVRNHTPAASGNTAALQGSGNVNHG